MQETQIDYIISESRLIHLCDQLPCKFAGMVEKEIRKVCTSKIIPMTGEPSPKQERCCVGCLNIPCIPLNRIKCPHSSHQSEQSTRQDEREKVLDEIMPVMRRLFAERCFKQDKGYCITVNVLSCKECFEQYLGELRKQM